MTLAVAAINLFWLLPWAASVVLWSVDGALALIVAYVPLLLLAVKFHAGELEKADFTVRSASFIYWLPNGQ